MNSSGDFIHTRNSEYTLMTEPLLLFKNIKRLTTSTKVGTPVTGRTLYAFGYISSNDLAIPGGREICNSSKA